MDKQKSMKWNVGFHSHNSECMTFGFGHEMEKAISSKTDVNLVKQCSVFVR